MSGSAKITSTDALDRFQASVKKFQHHARESLSMLRGQTQRVIDWLDNERLPYWKSQVRNAHNRMSEARIDLERAQMFDRPDERSSCQEQKTALEKAKRRLRLSQEKVEIVRRWQQVLAHEVIEFEARLGPLTMWLEADCPRGIAAIEKMARSLAGYLSTSIAQTEEQSTTSAANESTAEADTSDPPAGVVETRKKSDLANENTKSDDESDRDRPKDDRSDN